MLLVEKIHEDSKIPVRANPTDSGADVFIYDFKKKYELKDDDSEVENTEHMFNQEAKTVEVCATDINEEDDLVLYPFERVMVGTGIKVTTSLGKGYEIQVRPRSGLCLKEALTVLNTPGTVDESYRGEMCVILINLSGVSRIIKKGERVAQIIEAPVMLGEIQVVESLDNTTRGADGFGSTGKL
jgi:dUTP pyrophosphatase